MEGERLRTPVGEAPGDSHGVDPSVDRDVDSLRVQAQSAPRRRLCTLNRLGSASIRSTTILVISNERASMCGCPMPDFPEPVLGLVFLASSSALLMGPTGCSIEQRSRSYSQTTPSPSPSSMYRYARCDQCALLLEEIAARVGGLGLVPDRMHKHRVLDRVRGMDSLDGGARKSPAPTRVPKALKVLGDALGWIYRRDWFERPGLQAEFKEKQGDRAGGARQDDRGLDRDLRGRRQALSLGLGAVQARSGGRAHPRRPPANPGSPRPAVPDPHLRAWLVTGKPRDFPHGSDAHERAFSVPSRR